MLNRKTKQIAIFALVMLVISGSLFTGLMLLVFSKQEAFDQEVHNRALAIAREEQLESLTKLVEDTKTEREKINTFILQENSEIDFLTLTESIAVQQGVDLAIKNPRKEPIEGTDLVERLVLTTDIKGEYEAVTHMLGILESLPYQVDVSTVNMNKNSGNIWSGSFTIQVTMYKSP